MKYLIPIALVVTIQPAVAQTALETVSYIALGYRTTDEKWRVTRNSDSLEFLDTKSKNPIAAKIKQIDNCKYEIGYIHPMLPGVQAFSLDFSNLKPDAVRNDTPNSNNESWVYINGVKTCNHNIEVGLAAVNPGSCIDYYKTSRVFETISSLRKAITHLTANYCKPSAF